MNLIRKNFIYNNLLGFTNVLIPLVIFPYISRVFGPVGLGKVSFAISLATTFVVIGSLGIPIYGIREIAKVREDKKELSKTFSEILCIQFIWLLFVLIGYYLWIHFTNTFEGELIIKYCSFFHIVGIIGLLHWYYQGLENYRFIAFLNVFVKVLTVILLYTLVYSANQYWLYYLILVSCTFLGALISLFKARNNLQLVHRIEVKRHFKSILILFSTQIAIGIYANMDIVFLRYLSNEEQVGYYTPAIRLVKVLLLVITALGTVLIPKISNYIKSGNLKECESLITKSIRFVLLISFPAAILTYFFAFDAIKLFAGADFFESVLLLQMLTPLIFLIGMNNIFGLQILVPFHREKKLLIAVSFGALVSVILNLILIPRFESLGLVYSIVITELIITILTLYFAFKTFPFKYPLNSGLLYLFLALLFIPISMLTNIYLENLWYVAVNGLICITVYVSGLLLFRDKFFINTILKPLLRWKK